MKKYIIGLGCSWTQGEGGYPDHIVQKFNGQVQKHCRDNSFPKHESYPYEIENSWVNVLCRDYFQDYIPINLGVTGAGNRAAYNQLHFCDTVNFENSTGVIILMLSGIERLDFFHKNILMPPEVMPFEHYSNGKFWHNKWHTIWPFVGYGGNNEQLWTAYAKCLWSEHFAACSTMMVLLDLQTFAQRYGYKLVLSNAFNFRPDGILEYFKNYTATLFDKFDWTTYIHNYVPYSAFMEKLVQCDGLLPDWINYNEYYSNLSWPAKYLTNCQGAHPTIEGYKVIAQELASFIKMKYFNE